MTKRQELLVSENLYLFFFENLGFVLYNKYENFKKEVNIL